MAKEDRHPRTTCCRSRHNRDVRGALRRSELVALTRRRHHPPPAAACACWCPAPRPTSTAQARRRANPAEARRLPPRRSRRPWLVHRRRPPTSTGPFWPPRGPNGRRSEPSPRPAASPAQTRPTRRSPVWSSRPRAPFGHAARRLSMAATLVRHLPNILHAPQRDHMIGRMITCDHSSCAGTIAARLDESATCAARLIQHMNVPPHV
jgi:hypothetical protein